MTEETRGYDDGVRQYDYPFHVMAKPMGAVCNLECDYCYYLDKKELYPEGTDFRMDADTLETFIKQYIEAQPGPEVVFSWQGGEPTLRGIEFYQQAVQFQEAYASDDRRVVNILQTNGTRLNEEWCRFLSENEFMVGISMDGPRELHNRFRQTKTGGPTFDQVMNGLTLLQEYDIAYNVLCVVNAINSQYPLNVYEFFKEQGVQWLQFIPLVEWGQDDSGCGTATIKQAYANKQMAELVDMGEDADDDPVFLSDYPWPNQPSSAEDDIAAVAQSARTASVTERSVDSVAYGSFMCTIFDEWVRNDVGSVSVQLFDQTLRMAFGGEATLCVFRETCGEQVALEQNGDLYACDHFVERRHERGNIHEEHLAAMLGSKEQRAFGQRKKDDLPERCHQCPVQRFCHGGCLKDRHITAPNEDEGLNYLCAGYQQFFIHTQPYLKLFRRARQFGQPLPIVMDAVEELDRRTAS